MPSAKGLAALAAVVTGLVATASPAANLILNPEFATDASNWTINKYTATATLTRDASDGSPAAGSGLIADTAVGVPQTFELCTELVRPGGHVANVGVHGAPATLHLESLWIKDVTITTGLVDTYSTPTFLKLLAGQQFDATRFVTHHFALDEFMEAYDVFSRAGDTGALKVVLTR